MKTAIITDSGSGLVSHGDTYVLPLQIILDETSYRDGIDLTTHELYDLLAEGALPKTSLPSPGLIEETVQIIKNSGYDAAIVIPLSSGLSSTMQTVKMFCDDYELPCYCVECFSTCNIQKYLVEKTERLLAEGNAPETIVDCLNRNIEHSASLIFVSDLDYLKRGGRLTPIAASLAGLLKIKPLLILGPETNGKIDVKDKVRTERKVAKVVLDEVEKKLRDGRHYQVYVIHARKDEEARSFCDHLIERLEGAPCEVSMDDIGAVITSHTGLGCIALQFIEA